MKNSVMVILIVSLVVAGGILWVQQRDQTRLRRENESLHQQLALWARLPADAGQLSNQLAQTSATADAQMKELMKLRAEAATLHQQADQIAELQKQNQQLMAALTKGQNAQPEKTQTTSAARSMNLGLVQLINQVPNQFDMGGGRVCTLFPTVNTNGDYDIKATFADKQADGSTEIATAEIITSPSHDVVMEAGGNRVAFTPVVSQDHLLP